MDNQPVSQPHNDGGIKMPKVNGLVGKRVQYKGVGQVL